MHHHLIPTPYLSELRRLGVREVAGREVPEWSSELSLGVMDRHAIEMAVPSVSAPGLHFGDDAKARTLARRCNESSAEIVSAHPTRFGLFAAVPLPDVDGAIEEAAYALDVLCAD